MSTGPRIPREVALAAARHLAKVWNLGPDCMWVGSLRRGRADVGDMDLIAPTPAAGGPDALFAAIDATLEHDGQLFGMVGSPIGRAVKGHKRGFLSAWYELHLAAPLPRIKLQVSRYTPENLGWVAVMRTGPAEFGEEFLRRWKRAWSIPQGVQASIDGHLRDSRGGIVPVLTEAEAFRMCGMTYVKPEDRDEFVRRLGLGEEHLR